MEFYNLTLPMKIGIESKTNTYTYLSVRCHTMNTVDALNIETYENED